MKTHFLYLLFGCLLAQFNVTAQKSETKFVQITTIESVVGGGMGRSKMIITKEDGSQEEREICHLRQNSVILAL